MYTIKNLAEELEKNEYELIEELKTFGYLKQNGEPRQKTINNGLMNRNRLITKSGWISLIIEITIQESTQDKKNIKKYIRAANIGAKVFFKNYHSITTKFKHSMSVDSNQIYCLIEAINSICECITTWTEMGHTNSFIIKAFENLDHIPEKDFSPRTMQFYCDKNKIEQEILSILTEQEINKELDSVLFNLDISKNVISLIRNKWYVECISWDGIGRYGIEGFYKNCKNYDEAYQKARNHYKNEDKAIAFADLCWEERKLLPLKAK